MAQLPFPPCAVPRAFALLAFAIPLLTTGCSAGAGTGEMVDAPAAAADGAQPSPVSSDGPAAGLPQQTPPEGPAALDPWLAAGHYLTWRCEPGIQNARPNGAHGRTRICSNDLAGAHAAGPYPVGAAAVKELYGAGDRLQGYAVARKRTAGTQGSDWYWYERTGSTIYADGVGVSLCTGCHALARQRGGNDFVYFQIR